MIPINNAKMFQPKEVFDFCNHFFIISFSVNVKVNNKKRHQLTKIIGIKAHLPMSLPNKKEFQN